MDGKPLGVFPAAGGSAPPCSANFKLQFTMEDYDIEIRMNADGTVEVNIYGLGGDLVNEFRLEEGAYSRASVRGGRTVATSGRDPLDALDEDG